MHKSSTTAALLAAALLTAPSIRSQTSATTPTTDARPLTFDVVSIKRNNSGPGPAMILSPPDSDRILVKNASPRFIIGAAYDIALHDQITGLPGWTDTDAYDIEAKVADSDEAAFRKLLPMQRNPMLRPMLENRFHLKAHYETRELSAYALVLARGGPKITAVEPGTLPNGLKDPGGIDMGRNEITGTRTEIPPLLHVLQMQLGRPVVDRTGLTGNYNFKLTWTPDPVASSNAPAPAADSGPSLFTAVQEQLGLKLQPVKAPVPVLVVDHIERPSEN